MADKQGKLNASEIAPVQESVSLAGSESESIRGDIEQTRIAMDITLNRLSQRMTPRHLIDDVMDFFQRENGEEEGASRRTVREAGETALAKLKQFPVPATMIGAGLAWLLVDGKTAPRRRPLSQSASAESYNISSGVAAEDGYTGDEFQADQRVATQPGELLVGLKSQLNSVSGGVRDASRHATDNAGHSLHTGKDAVAKWLDDAPLAVGVAALAAGLLAGLLLPGTQTENELMGDAAEDLKTRARGVGSEVLESAHSVRSAVKESLSTGAAECSEPTESNGDVRTAPKDSTKPIRRQVNGGTAYYGSKIDRA